MLAVEADPSSMVMSVDVEAGSPLLHLWVVVAVERVAVAVTRFTLVSGVGGGWIPW